MRVKNVVLHRFNTRAPLAAAAACALLTLSGCASWRQTQPAAPVWGTVTTGELWRFMRLDGAHVSVDRDNETLHPLERLLGILLTIAQGA